MTTETLTGTPSKIISGIGPYTINDEYSAASDIMVTVRLANGTTVLLPSTDYTIFPDIYADEIATRKRECMSKP